MKSVARHRIVTPDVTLVRVKPVMQYRVPSRWLEADDDWAASLQTI
jgi:hypothetical protein